MSLANIFDNLKVIYHLVKPNKGKTHQERLENFYKEQAQYYDAFRKTLLKGREDLFESLVTDAEGIWIDMGGGTGANFECIAKQLNKFQKIYIVDLSTSLLEIAQQRIAKNKWNNVETIERDVTQFVPLEGAADVVTFSYSLSMMENWFEIIDRAYQLLKPGGVIGVVDFYVSRKHPEPDFVSHSWLTRNFWTIWFATDNVFLSPDRLAYLHYRFDKVTRIEKMAKLSFPPGFKAPYYLFIGRKN
ncbi:MAG: class I SAM-dependent methyltransferase [Prochloraceae cyanobacterium]|nr:class I SAM-dependent methyltransferase [Prochloraceae cyanobacterium]